MTTATDKKRKLIAQIHIAKAQLDLTDQEYRGYLALWCNGKVSSAKMTLAELMQAIQGLKTLGFKPKKPNNKRLSTSSNSKNKPRTGSVQKIRAIWITMGKQKFINDSSENALESYTMRMTAKLNQGQGIAKLDWLTEDLAYKVLESLKQWHKRLMIKALNLTIVNGKPANKVAYNTILDLYEAQHA